MDISNQIQVNNLIGMHQYHFFQNKFNTDTYIFGTCQYKPQDVFV